MAGPTSKSAWTAMERAIAAAWGTHRNPLSGANNRQSNGKPRPGDIILDGIDALVECKYRASFAHHKLFRAVQADAERHKISPRHSFLYTKLKRERGHLVTMDAEFFHQVCLPSVIAWLTAHPEGRETASVGRDSA